MSTVRIYVLVPSGVTANLIIRPKFNFRFAPSNSGLFFSLIPDSFFFHLKYLNFWYLCTKDIKIKMILETFVGRQIDVFQVVRRGQKVRIRKVADFYKLV